MRSRESRWCIISVIWTISTGVSDSIAARMEHRGKFDMSRALAFESGGSAASIASGCAAV